MAWSSRSEPGMFWPAWTAHASGVASIVLNSTNTKNAMVSRAAKTGVITSVQFSLGTVTTGQTLAVSLQDVGSDGRPDGVADQSTTVAVIDSDDNVTKTATFSPGRSVVRGDLVAIVFEWQGTQGNLILQGTYGDGYAAAYTLTWSGSWNYTYSPIFLYGWDDGVTVPQPQVEPPYTNTTTTYASNSSPDEYGNRFILPFSCECNGGWMTWSASGGSDMDLVLYDGSAELTSVRVLGSQSLGGQFHQYWPRPVLLTAGRTYRITMRPRTTSSFYSYSWAAASNAILAAFAWQGDANCYRTARTDLGGWTDLSTARMTCGISISAVDDGTGPAPSGWGVQGRSVGEEPPIILLS